MPHPFDIGDYSSTIFRGLSGFWQRFFRDTKDLQAFYRASEQYLGQVYLDFLSNVLSTSVSNCPVFNKEYWKLFAINENEVVYREGVTAVDDRFVYDLPGSAVNVDVLQNAIFAPDVTYEKEVDFDVTNSDGFLRFFRDPFRESINTETGERTPLDGVAWRWLDIEVGNQLQDASFTGDWITSTAVERGDTLRFLAYKGPTIQDDTAGYLTYTGVLTFTCATASFVDSHVGDIIHIYDEPTQQAIGYYIVKSILSPTAVVLENSFGAQLITTSPTLEWRHYKAVYYDFSSQDKAIDYTDGKYLIGNVDNPYPIPEEQQPFVYAVVREPYDATITGASVDNVLPTFLGLRHIVLDSVHVYATRNDGQAVEEGVDYKVDYLRGVITPIPYVGKSVQDGSAGYALNWGGVPYFVSSDPTVEFSSPEDIGGTITINTGGTIQTFIIADVVSSNTLILTDPDAEIPYWPAYIGPIWETRRLSNVPDWNPLSVSSTCRYSYMDEVILSGGGLTTEKVTGSIKQLSFWVPEVSIDRFLLYNNFGYLLNRFEASSETYRAFLKGIMYLYMSGPILYRVNSAMNVAAGYPVIQSNGEILQRYDSGVSASGTDGVMVPGTQSYITSASAPFTAAMVGGDIVVTSSINAINKGRFRIIALVDATSVEIEYTYTPVVETGLHWEVTTTYTRRVYTNTAAGTSRVYAYPYYVSIRADIIDPVNWGKLTFKSFDYLTTAFTVTDYLEDPQWWHNKYIPDVLWANTPQLRRLATSVLYENVVGGGDGPHVGDPGLFVGADETGIVYAPTDPNTGEPTPVHRHCAAFVLFDRFLKFHMFYISFDQHLELSDAFRQDLESLILVAKPSYTYPYVEPSAFMEDIGSLWDLFAIPEIAFTIGLDGIETVSKTPTVGEAEFRVGDYYTYTTIIGATAGVVAPVATPFDLPLPTTTMRLVAWQLGAAVGGSRVLEGVDYTIDLNPLSATYLRVTPLTSWDAGAVTYDALVIDTANIVDGYPDTTIGFTPIIVGGNDPRYIRKTLAAPSITEEMIDRPLTLTIDTNYPLGVPYHY